MFCLLSNSLSRQHFEDSSGGSRSVTSGLGTGYSSECATGRIANGKLG